MAQRMLLHGPEVWTLNSETRQPCYAPVLPSRTMARFRLPLEFLLTSLYMTEDALVLREFKT